MFHQISIQQIKPVLFFLLFILMNLASCKLLLHSAIFLLCLSFFHICFIDQEFSQYLKRFVIQKEPSKKKYLTFLQSYVINSNKTSARMPNGDLLLFTGNKTKTIIIKELVRGIVISTKTLLTECRLFSSEKSKPVL